MRRLLPLVMLLMLVACATGPEVRTDIAQGVDLSRFRSFGFESRLAEDAEGYASLTSQRLRSAVTRELEQRGYVLAEVEPDLLVNVSMGLQDRTRVVTSPGPVGPWGLRRDPFNDSARGWPGYWGSWDRVEPFTEGTVNVDLIDRARRQMVWEGVAVSQTADRFGRVSSAQLDASIAAIFANFPFRAGRG